LNTPLPGNGKGFLFAREAGPPVAPKLSEAELSRQLVTPPSFQLRKRAWPRDVVLRGFTPSSDYFDEIRQFLPGIEVYPFAGRVIIIGQTTISLALNPYQVLVIWNPPAGFIIFRV
jgi:hypothetical protein